MTLEADNHGTSGDRRRRAAALAGARAGRGFRYQDSVAATLATTSHVEAAGWTVSPEANEDISVATPAGMFLELQARSRRAQTRTVTAADLARWLFDLWERHLDRLPAENVVVGLVTDVTPTGCEAHGLAESLEGETAFASGALAELAQGAGLTCNDLLKRSHLLIAPCPAAHGRTLLAEHTGVLPNVAEVLYRQVLARVGDLVDERSAGGSAEGLTATETARLIVDGQRTVDVESIERPLRDGTCEFIDFESPVDDENFHRGVDVVPGHIAAGLVTERPWEVERCLAVLDSAGAAIVTGPSGIGKSAVALLAAHASRHVIRWIRVTDAGSAFELLNLTAALRASPQAPVGILVDDIGRIDAAMWDSLVRRARSTSGVHILGTTREEDLDLLEEAPESVVLRPHLDDDLAAAIWARLSADGSTTSVSWVEAFDQSRGLTLEFVHYLTTGQRLPDTIRSQVQRRRQERRDVELRLLRVVALAASHGAATDVRLFARDSALADEDIQRALHRVVDEHLVKSVGPNELAGLHRLRSEALVEATHELPPPSIGETTAQAIRCVTVDSLADFIASVTRSGALAEDELHDALTERLRLDPSAHTLSRCLEGLRISGFREMAASATVVMERHSVPAALRHTAAWLSMVPDTGIDDGFHPAIANALPDLRRLRPSDPRESWLARASSELIVDVIQSLTTTEGIELLESLGACTAEPAIGAAIARATPAPTVLQDVASFVNAGRLVGPNAAQVCIERVGGTEHLLEIAQHQPWVTHLEVASEGLDGHTERVLAFHLLCVDDAFDRSPHEEVVRLSELFFGLVPSADVIAGKAVDTSGATLGFRDHHLADKRIPRSNLPSAPEIRWHRELLNGFADAGSESRTDRLAVEADLLRRAVHLSRRIGDRWARRTSLTRTQIAELDRISTESAEVWRRERTPVEPDGAPRAPDIGDLASELRSLCGNAIPRLFTDPSMGLAAFLGDTVRSSLMRVVQVGYWRLLGTDRDDEVLELVSFVEKAHVVLGSRLREESVTAGAHPTLDLAVGSAKAQNEKALQTRLRNITERVAALGFEAEAVRTTPHERQALIWPADEVTVVIEIDSLHRWLAGVPLLLDAVRESVEPVRMTTIVPRRNGQLVAECAVRVPGSANGFPFPAEDHVRRVAERESLSVTTTAQRRVAALIGGVMGASSSLEAIDHITRRRPLLDVESAARDRFAASLTEKVGQLETALDTDSTGALAGLTQEALHAVDNADVAATVSAMAKGEADDLLGLLALIEVTEIELGLDSVAAVDSLDWLLTAANNDVVNLAVADLPGIPVGCAAFAAPGTALADRWRRSTTAIAFAQQVAQLASDGLLPQSVADLTLAWNDLKSSDPDFIERFERYLREDSQPWDTHGSPSAERGGQPIPGTPKVGRNERCPCGSGRKYKHCHGLPGTDDPVRFELA